MKVTKKKHSKLVRFLVVILVFILVACCAGVGLAFYWTRDLPACDSAEDYNVSSPTTVYAADATTVLASFSLQNRIPLSSLSEVGENAKWATVAVEDERYYDHGAVDIIGIARALWNNVTGGSIEGASTISQQLARNTVLSDEANDISLKRKVREAAVAIQMEQLFTKDEILLMYMNTINYGSGAYGIEAAAQRYFSKSASELTLSEAALLAGIPQSPTYNNPIDYLDNAIQRRNAVLDRMVANGFVTEAAAAAAKAESVVLETSDISTDGIEKYPYFTSYVRNELLNSYDLTSADIFEGGLTVYTTLDPTIQEYAQEAVSEKLDQVGTSYECALTAVDPNTGYIKAMVGGRDFYQNQYNLAAQAKRSPGSSFKTFTLVTAIQQGIDPKTRVNCASTVKIGDWEVKNYGYSNYGIQTISGAFAVSSNTGFARLIMAVGAQNVVNTAHSMGITSDLRAEGALTLGASEVTTLEMADAYATIANGGTHYDAVCITKAIDRKGNVVIDNETPQGAKVLSAEVAHAATEVMKGVITGGTGTAARLSNGQEAAGKTGTSEYEYDSWFCGFTPQMSVAIWLGDPDNERATTSTATSVFSAFMNQVLEGQSPVEFPEASDPEYTKTFSNTDLDVKTSYSSSAYYMNNTTNETANETANENANTSNTNEGGDPEGGSGEGGAIVPDSGSDSGSETGGGGSGSGDAGGSGGSTDISVAAGSAA
jgi:membrane peptidoglycan carboxypeptidase